MLYQLKRPLSSKLPVLLVALGCAAGTPSDLLITIETSGPGREAIPTAEKKDRLTWPQWRGPTRDAKYSGPKWPPAVDAKSLTRLWKVKLGPSYSGPIVSPDIVYTCLLYTSPSPRDLSTSRMPSSA